MGLRQAADSRSSLLVAGCGSSGDAARQPLRGTARRRRQPEWFVDRAADAGLDFVHVNGMSGQLYMPEILGPGVALFDYDNDGDLDVYLVQGQPLGPSLGPRGRDAADGPAVSQRSARSTPTARARCTSPTSPPRAASTPAATAWASPPATSTTTAGSIST